LAEVRVFEVNQKVHHALFLALLARRTSIHHIGGNPDHDRPAEHQGNDRENGRERQWHGFTSLLE
jgi:hypothetical protein